MITPSLPGAAVNWVSFWGPSWLLRCGSGWGLPTESPHAGAEPPRLPQGWLPTTGPSFPVGSLLGIAHGIAHGASALVSDAPWFCRSCSVADSQRGCGGFQLPVAPTWGGPRLGSRVAELHWGASMAPGTTVPEPSGTTGLCGCHGTGCSGSRTSTARTGGCCHGRGIGQSEFQEICHGRAVGQSETSAICRGRAIGQSDPGRTCYSTEISQSESKDVPQQSCWPMRDLRDLLWQRSRAISARRDLWWQSHRPTGSWGPAMAELPANQCRGILPVPQLSANQHWGDLPQPSCWPILDGGTRAPYTRPGSAGVATACCARGGPCPCLCLGCSHAMPVPCRAWDQDGPWQPRGAWGRSGTRRPGAARLGRGQRFTSLRLWAQGWCGQAMSVGLSSPVPAPVEG